MTEKWFIEKNSEKKTWNICGYLNDVIEENRDKIIILHCGMYVISPIFIRNKVFIERRRDCLLKSNYVHLLG
jgi:hypothetical protein